MKKLVSLFLMMMALVALSVTGCASTVEPKSEENFGISRQSLVGYSESGSFIGNGSSQSVTLGWEPAAVWIGSGKLQGGNSSTKGFSLKLSGMPGSATYYLRTSGNSYEASGGVTLTSTGFSVGSQAIHNQNGQTIYWWAIRNDGTFVDVGSYVGDQPMANATPQTVTLPSARDGLTAHTLVVRANTADPLFAIHEASMPAGAAGAIPHATRWGSFPSLASFQYATNTFTVANDLDKLAIAQGGSYYHDIGLNVSGDTYYYVVVYSTDGTQPIYTPYTTFQSGSVKTVNVGYPAAQLAIEGSHRLIISFDPMPADGNFACGGNNGVYQTQASLGSGTQPTRTATGFTTGTIGGSFEYYASAWR